MNKFMVRVFDAGWFPVRERTFKYANLAQAEFVRECEDERYTVVLFDTDNEGFWRSVHKREGEYETMRKQLSDKFHAQNEEVALLADLDWDNVYALWVRVSDYIGRTIYEGTSFAKMAQALVDHMREHPHEMGYRYNSTIVKEEV